MAIDTANKRISVLNVVAPYQRLTSVPDASVDDGDRYSLGFIYFGIAILAPAPTGLGSRSGGSQPHRMRRNM